MRVLHYFNDQDSLQDSVLLSVKELFESCEDELLPIEDQLKRYQKRNLNASHAHRTTRKVFGSQKALCRFHCANEDPCENTDFSKNLSSEQNFDTTLRYANGPSKNNSKTEEMATFSDEPPDESVREWVNKRKQLRNDLKSLGNVKLWLENKPRKTCLEENVLKQLKSTIPENVVHLPEASPPLAGFSLSVPDSMKRIAQVVFNDSSLISHFDVFSSTYISQEDFMNGLIKVQDATKLSAEDKEEILRLYYNEKTNTSIFHAALMELINHLQTSATPLITVTPATARNGRSSPKPLIEIKARNECRSNKETLDQQRNIRLEQYEKTVKRCQESAAGLSEARLQRVLLHPEDRRRSYKEPLVQVSNKALLSENFWKLQEKKRYRRRRRRGSAISTEIRESDDEGKYRGDSRSLIILPPLRDVAPEKHHVNLSTGRALVGRKVDCWMSAEEYKQITKNPAGIPLERERPNPNAFWPGHNLDKSRLWMSPCESHPQPACDKGRDKGNIFHTVGVRPHNGKKSNHGYNNNELTWPTDGVYVKYGDIDLKKVYQI